jgi:predicted MFS family arabinose efflux permease
MTNPKRSLLSPEFLLLCGVSFFAFCNMAVFYGFYAHMEAIGIPVEWRGWLLGLEPFTAFVLRLALIPLIGTANAARLLMLGLALLVVALLGYQVATTVATLIPLRILHGAAFVLLVSATVTLVVRFIPEDRSAQGFSLFSLANLLPYALMPPLTEALMPQAGNAAMLYAAVSVLALPAMLLLLLSRHRLAAAVADTDEAMGGRLDRAALREDLRTPAVLVLLGVNLCVYLVYSAVFFFLKTLAQDFAPSAVGAFFTLSTVALILTRLLGGMVLDRLPKLPVLRLALGFMALCLVGLSLAESELWLLALAVPYGIGVGLALPMLNAALFLASPPALRGVNTNLGLFMMDAGFFLTPWLGGAFLAADGTVGQMLAMGAGGLVLAVVMLLGVRIRDGAEDKGRE